MTRRNEKCPCGSGKKYKNCCMQADLEREKFQPKTDRPYEENPNVKTPTWVIFIAAAALLAILCGVLWLFDLGRLAGTVFGVGMLILIFTRRFATSRRCETRRATAEISTLETDNPRLDPLWLRRALFRDSTFGV